MSDPKGYLIVPCAFDPSGDLRSLELDALDNLKVSIEAGLPTGYKIQGYDGANWRDIKVDTSGRLIVDGESPSIFRPINKTTLFTNLTLPAGNSVQTITTVPAGEYWRLAGISMQYDGTVAGVTLRGRVNVGGAGNIGLLYINPPVNSVPYIQMCSIMLSPGWVIECQIVGATLNDDIRFGFFAERIM
jgi:hypothetical protein